jgi:hypothetical protein
MGQGPVTGRGLGYCRGSELPGFGRGRGYGRGMGYGRGYGFGPLPSYSKENEIQVLKDQAESLKRAQQDIEKRLSELEKE